MPSIPFYNGQVVTPPDYRYPMSGGHHHPQAGHVVSLPPVAPGPLGLGFYGGFEGHPVTAPGVSSIPPPPAPYFEDMNYNMNYPFRPLKPAVPSYQQPPSYSSNGTTFYLSSGVQQPGSNKAQVRLAHHQLQSQLQPPQPHNVPPPPAPHPPAAAQQQITGGVAANLDYNIEDMAEFLSTMAHGIMDTSGMERDPEFIKSFCSFVNQVLTATRLPRETVILALVYLSKRWALGSVPNVRADSSAAYHMLVVALVLANKFHDDNTFTNKSWFEATGIPIAQITSCEAAWLKEIKWSLHVHEKDFKGWEKWNDCWNLFVSPEYQQQASPKSMGRLSFPTPPHGVALQSPKSSSPKRSSYTIPKWYEAAHQQYGGPVHRLESASIPQHLPPPPPYAPVALMPEPSFVSYFQQSFAVDNGDMKSHPRHRVHGHVEPMSHQSYYVSAYNNMATCNCSVCSFDSRSNWFMGSVAAC
jgi:Cyclin, N-terminal domain